MTRQSISFTVPNDNWLKSQIENQEFKSKSEVINDLVRKARAKEVEIELIRQKLIQAEKSGFINQNQKEILSEFKKDLKIEQKL